jgi:uncharacterized protein YcfJ
MRSLITIVLIIMTGSAAAADLFIYPNMGQDPEQQRRDRFECHVWAARQSGFDPSTYQAPQPVRYPPLVRREHSDLNPVTGAAGGAAAGAVGGAIAGDAGKGAAIGAGVGAVLGAFHTLMRQDEQRDRRVEMREQRVQQEAETQQLRDDYNRAISACLEGRGYTVK